MDYFAGLDISMDETHVCVLDREGVVVRESKTESTAEAIAGEICSLVLELFLSFGVPQGKRREDRDPD
jgi:hypothetical protein